MNRLGTFVLLFCVVVAGHSAAVASTAGSTGQSTSTHSISSCTVIDTPGEYVLTTDVRSDADHCLDVRANHVTIRGEGHEIVGPSPDSELVGVFVNSSNVRIENLGVRNWGEGVVLYQTTANTLDGVSVSDTDIGVRTLETVRTKFRNVSVSGSATDGIHLESDGRARLVGTTVTDSDETGLFVQNSTNTTISNLESEDNELGVELEYSDGTHLTGSTVRNNREYGVTQTYSNDVRLTDDVVGNNGEDGIRVRLSEDSVIGNATVRGNGDAGIWASNVGNSTIAGTAADRNDIGIVVLESSAVEVDGNRVWNNDDDGLLLDRSPIPQSPGTSSRTTRMESSSRKRTGTRFTTTPSGATSSMVSS